MTADHTRDANRLGLILLLSGIALLGIEFLHRTTGLPFWVPQGWYTSRVLRMGLGIGLIIASWRVQRPQQLDSRWSPAKPGVRFSEVILYSREGCHLCDDARDMLFKYADHFPTIHVVNIDEHPDLVEQFDTCVPVVECDGKLRFRGRVDEVLLRRLIEGTPPQ
jgi:glutaredoxin